MMTANGLAKLMEECGELTQVCAKKLACMDSDQHWDGAGSLKTRMEDEIADMAAASMFVVGTFDLDTARIGERTNRKLAQFLAWHEQQNDAPKESKT